jgi:hydrogenase-1 operon protein HyaF
MGCWSGGIVSSLEQIRIEVAGMENRALVHSILLEIATLLERYLQHGEPGELDLHSLPLIPADRQALQRALGRGEVTMQLNVMGESEIIETRFPGVWRIVHRDPEGRTVAEGVEVRPVPSIIAAARSDMRRSVEQIMALAAE